MNKSFRNLSMIVVLDFFCFFSHFLHTVDSFMYKQFPRIDLGIRGMVHQ